jgi:FlaA1/EpsC-like NDP-sugar epimerase
MNQPHEHHDHSDQQQTHHRGAKMYARFAGMIATSAALMYLFTYWNTYELSHIWFSETRLYMTLAMTAMMAIVMLSFMLHMLDRRGINTAIYVGSITLIVLGIWLVRSQATVQDASYMKAMIPHHSIAILTSERAEITDPRVRSLADEIMESQKREISMMEALIRDIEQNGTAQTNSTAPTPLGTAAVARGGAEFRAVAARE